MDRKSFLSGVVAAVIVLAVASSMGAVKGISDLCESSPKWESYTASDSTNFAYGPSRRIRCKTAGTVQLVDTDGTVVPCPVSAGENLDVRALRINATSTTNTGAGEFFIQN